jgi:hypothetical protein
MNTPVKIKVTRPPVFGYEGTCTVELVALQADGSEMKLVKFSCANHDMQVGISAYNLDSQSFFPGKLLDA